MQYRNRNTGAVLPREQAQKQIRNVANPTEAHLADAGWLPTVPFELPEGHVKIAGTQTWEEYDGAFFEQHETETTEAREALQAAEREAAFIVYAADHGGKLGALAGALAVFGLAIPISEPEAMSRIESMMPELSPQQVAMIGTLAEIWRVVKQYIPAEDIGAVWEIVQGGGQ